MHPMKHLGKLMLKLGSSTDLHVADDNVVVQIGWRSAVVRSSLVSASLLHLVFNFCVAPVTVLIQLSLTYMRGNIYAR